MNKIKKIAVISFIAVLTACGGGGGDGGDGGSISTPKSSTAEGFWYGTTDNGLAASLAILDNGEIWGLYTDSKTMFGAVYGNTNYSGNTLTGEGIDFFNGNVTKSSFKGEFSEKNKLNINIPGSIEFNGIYDQEYEQPASLDEISGGFSGYAFSVKSQAESTLLEISQTGVVKASNSYCDFSGNVTPRSSGKNVFDLNGKVSGQNCALPSGTSVEGVVFYDNVNKSIIAMALNSNKDDGLLYVGTK